MGWRYERTETSKIPAEALRKPCTSNRLGRLDGEQPYRKGPECCGGPHAGEGAGACDSLGETEVSLFSLKRR